MPRAKDTRRWDRMRASEQDAAAAAALMSDNMPGDQRVRTGRVNPLTGSPVALAADNLPASADPLIDRALAFVQREAALGFGFAAGDAPEFVPDPHIQQTSGGAAVVHLHQQYHGIPIFEMTRSVQFLDGRIERVVGDNCSLEFAIDTAPKITAAQALSIAARYLAENDDEPGVDHWGQALEPSRLEIPAGYEPRVIAAFDRPSRPTVLDKGPFADEVQAGLVVFYRGEDARLSWRLRLRLPENAAEYLMLVAADREINGPVSSDTNNSLVLLCKDILNSAVRASVYLHNPGQHARSVIEFPRLADSYPLSAPAPLPDPFPPAWWVESSECNGNCTRAVIGFTASTISGSVNGTDISFLPAGEEDDDQKVLNTFFFCNYMHDFFYMLGFDEAAGNFQRVNFTGQGAGGDAVLARVHPGRVRGTANMSTPEDGLPPLMNMGAVVFPDGSSRHTGLDSDVVFHEYLHGVTNRLVGGRLNSDALEAPQSRGMGEGWGDYFALTIQNYNKPVEKVVTGDWVSKRPGGIRRHPYDSNYPATFGDIGAGHFTEEHNIGEIWCAALMQMNRNFNRALNSPTRGHEIAWQAVVDGLKLSPANPGFLDARDAILRALSDLNAKGKLSDGDFQKLRRAAWDAFARFGMGENARSNGPSLEGVIGDNTIPAGV